MVTPSEQHHHRSTTKVSHKAYKTRFTSKNALKEQAKGKVERAEKGSRRTPQQQTMSKFDRKNQAKQRRLANHQDHIRATNVFAGRDGAPRIVAVIGLCEDVSPELAVRSLNSSLDLEDELPSSGRATIAIDRFKQRVTYVQVGRDLVAALDACRVADYVLLVLSADQEVDDVGETLIRAIESQGVSNVYTAVQGLENIEPAKRRPQVVASLKSFITHFFPSQEKVFSLESRQEMQNLVRSLCTTTPKGIRWREERSWMLAEDVQTIQTDGDQETTTVVVTGVVRGKSMKADRLLQVGDWGAFQISKITAAPLEQHKKGKGNMMAVDDGNDGLVVDQPTEDQDNLDELAPEETVMEDVDYDARSTMTASRKGVLLDDHHYLQEDTEDEDEIKAPKRLPKGTSKYQAAWYLGNMSDSGSDMEDADEEPEEMDDEMDTAAGPADGTEGMAPPPVDPTEAGPSEYPQSEMFVDPTADQEAAELAAYRERKKGTAAQEDLQFPDEIELHPNVSARERLARYRGLKSLRTSVWDTEEDKLYEPQDWARLLEVHDYKGAQSRVLRDSFTRGVAAGTRVSVYITGVPTSLVPETFDATRKPLPVFSLLRHEHKRTSVNYSISLDGAVHPNPIKSKEELIVQCGPRRFVIHPLFSQGGNTPNNVHKFERFLHPGRPAVASFTAPMTWGSVPVLFFKRALPSPSAADEEMETDDAPLPTQDDTLTLIGHGTALPPSSTRVIAKRIVLTGEAYKINRRVVTVRHMFFSPEDVAYFSALQLWTNRGRGGTVKESLGTHGYFKAMFDGQIGMQDAVGVSLYKRVWPRPAVAWRGV